MNNLAGNRTGIDKNIQKIVKILAIRRGIMVSLHVITSRVKIQ